MIKSIKLINYKCYESELFKFKSGLNLLVGENDSGKSTVLDAIRVFSGDKIIEDLDNHNNGTSPIEIILEADDGLYLCRKAIGGDLKFYQMINLGDIKNNFDSGSIVVEDAKQILSILGINQQGATTLQSKKTKFEEYITNTGIDITTNPIKEIEVQKSNIIGNFSNIKYEDGKKFQNIQENFKSFVKDSVNTIWSQPIGTGSDTIADAVKNNLNTIKSTKETDYRDNMLPTIKEIMPEVVDIQMTLKPQLGNFNGYDAQIDFINASGNPIPIDRKGDGTKRRVTLAMFKIESNSDAQNNIYLLDEPDTHLNLRVQQDLVTMFENLATSGHQVIFTTHSPFILNLISISDIIMVKHDGVKSQKVDTNLTNPEEFEITIYNLGIQNIDIFFSKYFLFFEGDTEKEFFSRAYQRKYGTTIEKKFVRQIIADGIDNEAIFMANFQRIIGDNISIICVVDSDYIHNRKSKGIIDGMEAKYHPLLYFKKFSLGTKEFEDLFSTDTLYECFTEELTTKFPNKSDFEVTLNGSTKKSEFLSHTIGIGKPAIGKRLANYIDFDNLHADLQAIITHIYSLS